MITLMKHTQVIRHAEYPANRNSNIVAFDNQFTAIDRNCV